MKRISYLALLAALLTYGFTSVLAADAQPANNPDENSNSSAANSSPAATLDLSWISINGGGASYGSGGTRRIGYSVGQSVAGEGSGGTRRMGIGFWYGSGPVCSAAKGDMNADMGYTPSDVVLMLNCVFLASGSCHLCFADVNCDSSLTPSDVVLELNRVFLAAPLPC